MSITDLIASFIGRQTANEVDRTLDSQYSPPMRDDVLHDGLVGAGKIVGSTLAGAYVGLELGAFLGSFVGPVGFFAGGLLGTAVGGIVGYFAGGWAGHFASGFVEIVGGVISNPSTFSVDPLGNPIGPFDLNDKVAINTGTTPVSFLEEFQQYEQIAVPRQTKKCEGGRLDMTETDAVLVERDGPVTIVSINRPHCRNAVDGATARKLYDTFLAFDADEAASVVVFTGTGGYFCAGADLKAVASGDPNKKREIGGHDSIAPMGPSRLRLSKPVIAAVEGFAVAGGMELALWADMRVVAEDATFGIFCRRFGVPLIDLGTIRLPRLIGHSQAIDLILTGRPVGGAEALRMGLANRLVPKGEARTQAIALAKDIAAFPQNCMRADRLSALRQWDLEEEDAIANEMRGGLAVIASGETLSGAARFASGAGRHGAFGGTGRG